jgi:hypothetical protein
LIHKEKAMGMTVEKNGSHGTETYGPFMRKAVRVEAYRFNNYAGSRGDRPRWLLEAIGNGHCRFVDDSPPCLIVKLAHEWVHLEIGDWIVKDGGELSVHASEIFNRDFERLMVSAERTLLNAAQKALDECVDLIGTPAGDALAKAIARATGDANA